MVQLEELVTVQGHDREAITATDAELAQRTRDPFDPIEMLRVGRGVRTVDHPDLVGVAVRGRQKMPVVHELFHGGRR